MQEARDHLSFSSSPAARALARRGVVNRLDRDRLYEAFPYTIPMPDHLAELLHLLAWATPLEPPRVPPDLVTMNSVVRIVDPRTGGREDMAIVYPYQADAGPMATSVTAPAGAALFGRRAGEYAIYRTGTGIRVTLIEGLAYQPEREGHLDT